MTPRRIRPHFSALALLALVPLAERLARVQQPPILPGPHLTIRASPRASPTPPPPNAAAAAGQVWELSSAAEVARMHVAIVPSPGTPRYCGIMLRTAMWDTLEESIYRLLSEEFGGKRKVAPRAWFFGAQIGEQTFLTIARGDRSFNARGIVGLTPQENEVTRPGQAIIAGRWFLLGDVRAVILPKEIADALGVSIDDVNKHSAFVRYGGLDYRVVGMIDSDSFQAIKDLDREPITPVDFILVQKQSSRGEGGGGEEAGEGKAALREYTHLEPSVVFIMPFQTLMNVGGEVRSIAIRLRNGAEVDRVQKELMPRLRLLLSVWVNTKSGVYWRSGTRYYGKTKEGKYMSEAGAINAGYHPARGR